MVVWRVDLLGRSRRRVNKTVTALDDRDVDRPPSASGSYPATR